MQDAPRLPDHIFLSLPIEAQVYIRYLEERIRMLEGRLQSLENRLAKSSVNSSKPPSQDGLSKKTKSLRVATGKKPGGQPGHVGRTLMQTATPDHVVDHSPERCSHCHHELTSVATSGFEPRQVFDLPPLRLEVTEHRAHVKRCPCCRRQTKASFPQNVTAPVQYGVQIQSLVVYLDHQHFIPADRLCQLFQDLFGASISEGVCARVEEKLYKQLAPFEENLKTCLAAAEILHVDETGMRCKKKLHWIHVASTKGATFYGFHERRGKEAIDSFGVMAAFKGRAIHDHWAPYFSYTHVNHGLCNAHHLRELTYVHEQEGGEWAAAMKEHLIRAKRIVEKAQGVPLCEGVIGEIECEYRRILLVGARHYLAKGVTAGKSGKNLLARLAGKMSETLAFIYDPQVPFTNNQAEQDIRMVKIRQKVSGCFRTLRGGEIFCRIRSYISTSRKQGWNIWEALTEALSGQSRLMTLSDA